MARAGSRCAAPPAPGQVPVDSEDGQLHAPPPTADRRRPGPRRARTQEQLGEARNGSGSPGRGTRARAGVGRRGAGRRAASVRIHVLRGLLGRGHQHDVGAELHLEQARQQRVVRASQDQRVDAPPRSGARYPRAAVRSSSLVVSPRSTCSTKTGQAAASGAARRRRVAATARSYAPLATVASVPMTPTTPLRVAWTAALRAGVDHARPPGRRRARRCRRSRPPRPSCTRRRASSRRDAPGSRRSRSRTAGSPRRAWGRTGTAPCRRRRRSARAAADRGSRGRR